MLNTIACWRVTSRSKSRASTVAGAAAISSVSAPAARAVPILLGTYTRRMGRRDAARAGLFFLGLNACVRPLAGNQQRARFVACAVVMNFLGSVDDEAA